MGNEQSQLFFILINSMALSYVSFETRFYIYIIYFDYHQGFYTFDFVSNWVQIKPQWWATYLLSKRYITSAVSDHRYFLCVFFFFMWGEMFIQAAFPQELLFFF